MSVDQKQEPLLLGVDTGGTFTDFSLWSDDGLVVHKVLSTPEAPERAIIQGLQDLGIADLPLLLRHQLLRQLSLRVFSLLLLSSSYHYPHYVAPC